MYSTESEIHPQQLCDHLRDLVDRMIAKRNPLALPLSNMVDSVTSVYTNRKGDLPPTFEGELQALKLTVEAQALREIQPEERIEWFLHIRVLFPRSDSDFELGELLLQGLVASQSIHDLAQVISDLIKIPLPQLLLKHRGELLSTDSEQTLRSLFGKQVGEFVVNAFSRAQGMDLGLGLNLGEDGDGDRYKDMPNLVVCVNVPLQGGEGVDQLRFEVENSGRGSGDKVDLGMLREWIAEELSTDSYLVVLKHKGRFLFPSEDVNSLSFLFKGSSTVREVQLSAYTKEAALAMGQMDDYTCQLIGNGNGNGSSNGKVPVGGVEIPFMRVGKESNTPMNVEIQSEEERKAVEEFIERHRKAHVKEGEKEREKEEKPDSSKDTYTPAQVYRKVPLAPLAPPPPPIAPPAPPPPPPPGVPTAATKSRPKEPKSGCRLLFWEKIPPLPLSSTVNSSSKSSVWTQLPPIETPIDTKLLLECFKAQKTVRTERRRVTTGPSREGKENQRGIQLPNEKYSQNVEIMLRHLPKLDELVQSINQMKGLSRDQLEVLIQNLPEEADMRFVANLKLSVSTCSPQKDKISPTVAFLHGLINIPHWKQRLLLYKLSFESESRLDSLHQSASSLSTTISSIVSLPSLPPFLSLVLSTGNFMNRATVRGQAKAFRIDGLLKLSCTRMTNGTSNGSLLDVIVESLSSSTSGSGIDCLGLGHELGGILLGKGKGGNNNKSTRRGVSVQVIEGDWVQLKRELDEVLVGLNLGLNLEGLGGGGDVVLDKAVREALLVRERVEGFKECLDELREQGRQLLYYFGLGVLQASVLFGGMYPEEIGGGIRGKSEDREKERRKKEVMAQGGRNWSLADIEGLYEVLRDTSLSRNRHRGMGGGEGEGEEVVVLERERREGLEECKKRLEAWREIVGMDEEVLRMGSGSDRRGKGANGGDGDKDKEHIQLSQGIQGLFKLLEEFSIVFSERVSRLVKSRNKSTSERVSLRRKGKLLKDGIRTPIHVCVSPRNKGV